MLAFRRVRYRVRKKIKCFKIVVGAEAIKALPHPFPNLFIKRRWDSCRHNHKMPTMARKNHARRVFVWDWRASLILFRASDLMKCISDHYCNSGSKRPLVSNKHFRARLYGFLTEHSPKIALKYFDALI
jgi:hypothetical protein